MHYKCFQLSLQHAGWILYEAFLWSNDKRAELCSYLPHILGPFCNFSSSQGSEEVRGIKHACTEL